MMRLGEFDDNATAMELPEKPLKEWRAKFEANSLMAADLMDYFHATSPLFFSIEHSPDYNELGRCSFDERGAKSAIIDVIEEFIFGDNPQIVLEKIKAEENVSNVCGRVFKMGEPFYSCRECGMDPTCVLCVNCFKQSAHRRHKYKMGTSGGGGCCDCGDSEAWKQDPYCDEHTKVTDKILESTVINERMRQRCLIVFDAVMSYCVQSLKIESQASLSGQDGDSDIYCTVLYNDETHTFEQVIQTLTRVVKCTQKDSIDYVSSIDREGRAVVKCAHFDFCIKLKSDIERQTVRNAIHPKTVSLKVSVLHKNAVAYQQCSLQLLAWFQEFLSRHAVFRFIFCEMSSATHNTTYNLRDILLNDWKLWKTARTSWHHLLISGMLMEYENKKTLAVMFTKQYTRIMQDFIHDDHDHSFSVVSLSVQLFTVPSIAQHLIAHESAFFKLMHTFYSESIESHVKKKVLQFARNTANMNVFKRAAYILYDLKYILSFKPDVWTDDLRKNFLHGCQLLIRLLKEMQGMDSVYRQTGQHMEYEPEWESAFNLHIKLAPVISLVLEWCSTDKIVLIKVYRMVVAALNESDFIVGQTTNEAKELADHSATCLMYDVLSKPVSIHLPLSRFFAGLYVHFEKYGLDFISISPTTTKPSPEQIIEPVLSTLTMIAQVHAGLWRRNGYSLINQLYFYRNVKCRSEMLDRDIVILQIGATLIERNEFLIHVLNKFNLINWASPDYEATSLQCPEDDSIRQVINMVDEMLELLIVIIGERHIPGVGILNEEDKMKKEIIQQLCIKPFTHSELSRSLWESQRDRDDSIENVIDSVAVFKKPNQSDKIGVYELKPEFYEDYNMYFYHYTKEEKSKSEEEQRKRRKDKGELVCCPPPKLPHLRPLFDLLTDLLQCDVMLLIMQTVLKRALNLKARSFSESHLQKILHLIGYALQEQESGHYSYFTFYDRASYWGILNLMEELVSSPRVEAHRELIMWTVSKYKELQPKDADSQAIETEDTNQMVEASSSGRSAADIERAEKEDRARMAAERRAQIMAQMAKAQKNFMSTNADLFESTATAAQEKYDNMEWQENDENQRSSSCLGPNRKYNFVEEQMVTCILCSEDALVNRNDPCMVYSAFVQKSNVLTHQFDPAPHTSTCGHVMHGTCWKDYYENEVLKETRRPNRRPSNSHNSEKKEFLCPLCRCLSNAVLPILPPLSRLGLSPQQAMQQRQPSLSAEAINGMETSAIDDQSSDGDVTNAGPIDFEKWLCFMRNYNWALQQFNDLTGVTGDSTNLLNRMPDIKSIIDEISSMDEFRKLSQPVSNDLLSKDLKNYIDEFTSTVKRIVPISFADQATEPHLDTWISCSYTIQALEMYLRALNKPLKGQMSIRQTSCLTGLIRASGLLITTINDDIVTKLMIQWRSQLGTLFNYDGNCLIEWDLFKMLVTLVFTTPCVLYARSRQCCVPNGTLLEFYLLQMIFVTLITKIVILAVPNKDEAGAEPSTQEAQMDVDEANNQSPIDEMESGSSNFASILVDFYLTYGLSREEENVKKMSRQQLQHSLIAEVKRESSVFLRCCCLLFHFMTDVDMPDDLFDSDGDTFEVMCEYLGLNSNIEAYLQCSGVIEFMSILAGHPDVEQYRTGTIMKDALVPCAPAVRKLIDLPEDYSDLINNVSTFTCPNNDRDDSRNPTMCLVCGKTLCSMTYCCQKDMEKLTVGACTYHATQCGAGVGIFLRIRECEILLLGLNKGSFVLPPYLDKYGETDQGLRRGNPLTLCSERYAKLHLLWLNHSLHEDIARSAEASNSVIPTQWQHL